MMDLEQQNLLIEKHRKTGNAFTAGYIIDKSNNILLVNKVKPLWQRGLWNFVGGKLEEDEFPLDCMVREVHQEVGIKTLKTNWNLYCVEYSDDFVVFFYRYRHNEIFDHYQLNDTNDVGENIKLFGIHKLPDSAQMIGDLTSLISLAQDPRDIMVTIECKGKGKNTYPSQWTTFPRTLLSY